MDKNIVTRLGELTIAFCVTTAPSSRAAQYAPSGTRPIPKNISQRISVGTVQGSIEVLG